MIPTITPQALRALIQQGKTVDLIDVRTPEEFREARVAQACNIPLDTLDVKQVILQRASGSEPLYCICRSGGRSEFACEVLQAAGFGRAVNVEGGTLAWIEAGFPVAGG